MGRPPVERRTSARTAGRFGLRSAAARTTQRWVLAGGRGTYPPPPSFLPSTPLSSSVSSSPLYASLLPLYPSFLLCVSSSPLPIYPSSHPSSLLSLPTHKGAVVRRRRKGVVARASGSGHNLHSVAAADSRCPALTFTGEAPRTLGKTWVVDTSLSKTEG